jgi:hypothetical protein
MYIDFFNFFPYQFKNCENKRSAQAKLLDIQERITYEQDLSDYLMYKS